ncbi:MAG: hypothetical protein ACE5ET_01175 [Gammaproteobacteria bacterium]
MKQEINLYQERFKKTRIIFTAGAMLTAGLAILLLAGVWSAWEAWRLNKLAGRLLTINQQLVQLEGEQQDLRATLKKHAPSAKLVARLKKLETVAAYQAPLEEIMSSNAFPDGSGYSDFFLAFARQDLRGTWLTHIRIVGAGREILFKGYATKPELVPRYLQRLSGEQVMQGTAFQDFHMVLPEKEAGKRRPTKIAFSVSSSLDEANWPLDEE